MVEVRLRPRAKRDLMSAVIYIGEVCGSPAAAKELYESFWNEVELVRANPKMGVRYVDPVLENSGYRWVLVGKYRVFYRYEEGTVIVWRIIHCSQDIDEFELIDWDE